MLIESGTFTFLKCLLVEQIMLITNLILHSKETLQESEIKSIEINH